MWKCKLYCCKSFSRRASSLVSNGLNDTYNSVRLCCRTCVERVTAKVIFIQRE